MGELSRAARGRPLPALERPASAGQILSGYQAIAEDGTVLTGTCLYNRYLTSLSPAAGAAQIKSGYKAYNSAGVAMTGTYGGAQYTTEKPTFSNGKVALPSVVRGRTILAGCITYYYTYGNFYDYHTTDGRTWTHISNGSLTYDPSTNTLDWNERSDLRFVYSVIVYQ